MSYYGRFNLYLTFKKKIPSNKPTPTACIYALYKKDRLFYRQTSQQKNKIPPFYNGIFFKV